MDAAYSPLATCKSTRARAASVQDLSMLRALAKARLALSVPSGDVAKTLPTSEIAAALFGSVATAWVGKGGFNVTSTCEFGDEMCQGKGPLFETSTKDDLSSQDMSRNGVRT